MVSNRYVPVLSVIAKTREFQMQIGFKPGKTLSLVKSVIFPAFERKIKFQLEESVSKVILD